MPVTVTCVPPAPARDLTPLLDGSWSDAPAADPAELGGSVTDLSETPEPKPKMPLRSAIEPRRSRFEQLVGRGKRQDRYTNQGVISAAGQTGRADASEASVTGIAANAVPGRNDIEGELIVAVSAGVAGRRIRHGLLLCGAVRRGRTVANRANASSRRRPTEEARLSIAETLFARRGGARHSNEGAVRRRWKAPADQGLPSRGAEIRTGSPSVPAPAAPAKCRASPGTFSGRATRPLCGRRCNVLSPILLAIAVALTGQN